MLGFNGGTIGIANTVFTGSKSNDPNYSSVSLLLNGNGTNGSTTFTDSSSYGHTVTANGNAQISTTQSKFGGASMYFDGSGDYLTLTNDASFVFGTGDFTVEMWVYHTSQDSLKIYYDGRPPSTNGAYVALYKTSQNKLALYVNTANRIVGTTSILQNAWYHIAVCRQGSSTKLFLNGIQEGSTFTDTTNYLNGTSRPIIGADGFNPSASSQMQGYIDDLRITKGVARYTSNFTPPTAQLPGGETGTFASGLWTSSDHIKQIRNELWPGLVPSIVTDGLVLHLDAGDSASYPGSGTTWTDLSGNGNDATLFGTPSYTASPGYFDITSDSTYARLSSYSHLTNDFTYSMWVRFDAFGSYDTLIENGYWPDVGPLFRVENTTSITVFAEGPLRGTFTWSPSTNTWYNVVYTRSGSTNTLYVNGTQSGSTFTDQTNISLSNAYTILMRSQHSTGQFTNGQLAQYAMYNKALTSSEITQNFDVFKGRYGL